MQQLPLSSPTPTPLQSAYQRLYPHTLKSPKKAKVPESHNAPIFSNISPSSTIRESHRLSRADQHQLSHTECGHQTCHRTPSPKRPYRKEDAQASPAKTSRPISPEREGEAKPVVVVKKKEIETKILPQNQASQQFPAERIELGQAKFIDSHVAEHLAHTTLRPTVDPILVSERSHPPEFNVSPNGQYIEQKVTKIHATELIQPGKLELTPLDNRLEYEFLNRSEEREFYEDERRRVATRREEYANRQKALLRDIVITQTDQNQNDGLQILSKYYRSHPDLHINPYVEENRYERELNESRMRFLQENGNSLRYAFEDRIPAITYMNLSGPIGTRYYDHDKATQTLNQSSGRISHVAEPDSHSDKELHDNLQHLISRMVDQEIKDRRRVIAQQRHYQEAQERVLYPRSQQQKTDKMTSTAPAPVLYSDQQYTYSPIRRLVESQPLARAEILEQSFGRDTKKEASSQCQEQPQKLVIQAQKPLTFSPSRSSGSLKSPPQSASQSLRSSVSRQMKNEGDLDYLMRMIQGKQVQKHHDKFHELLTNRLISDVALGYYAEQKQAAEAYERTRLIAEENSNKSRSNSPCKHSHRHYEQCKCSRKGSPERPPSPRREFNEFHELLTNKLISNVALEYYAEKKLEEEERERARLLAEAQDNVLKSQSSSTCKHSHRNYDQCKCSRKSSPERTFSPRREQQQQHQQQEAARTIQKHFRDLKDTRREKELMREFFELRQNLHGVNMDMDLWRQFIAFLKTLGNDAIYQQCITLITLFYFFQSGMKGKMTHTETQEYVRECLNSIRRQ